MGKLKNMDNPFALVSGSKGITSASTPQVSKRKIPKWAHNQPFVMKKNLSVYIERSILDLFDTVIREIRDELPKPLAEKLTDNTIVELIVTYVVKDHAAGVNQSSIIKRLVNEWTQTANKK